MKSMTRMVVKLKEVIAAILSNSDHIVSASEQLSSTSEQISQGASQQASNVEEVSGTVEEINANIQQDADNAQQTNKIALSAKAGIEIVNRQASMSVQGSREIAAATAE